MLEYKNKELTEALNYLGYPIFYNEKGRDTFNNNSLYVEIDNTNLCGYIDGTIFFSGDLLEFERKIFNYNNPKNNLRFISSIQTKTYFTTVSSVKFRFFRERSTLENQYLKVENTNIIVEV